MLDLFKYIYKTFLSFCDKISFSFIDLKINNFINEIIRSLFVDVK